MSVGWLTRRIRGINRRIATVAVHDVFMAALSFELAVWFRYQNYGKPQDLFFLWHGTAIFTVICALVFWRMGLYRGIWHYASLSDLIAIVKAVTLAILIYLPVMFVLDRLANFPRSAMFLNWPMLVVFLSASRLLYRFSKDGDLRAVFEHTDDGRVPVLLIGADDEAEAFIRGMARDRVASYRVVGIVDRLFRNSDFEASHAGRVCYTDNYYTSLKLMQHLYVTYKMFLVGSGRAQTRWQSARPPNGRHTAHLLPV